MKIQIIILLIISALLAGCEKNIIKQDNGISNNISKQNKELSKTEDFNDFRKRFYSDSIFQMSRIVFPLKGACNYCYEEWDIQDQKDTNALSFFIKDHIFYWKKENWELLIECSDVIGKVTRTSNDKKKEERVTNADVNINNGAILIFELIDNKWYLTNLNVYS